MGLTPLRIAMGTGILLVVFLLVREILSWRAGTRIVTSKQKALRIASAFLTIIIMAMILAGDKWLAAYGPLAVMAYWMLCFVFAVVLVILALMDLKEVGLGFGEERKKIIREIAKPTEEHKNDE